MLKDLGGDQQAYAVAINPAGQSIGSYLTANGYEAALWSRSGTVTKLQNASGFVQSAPFAINASGQSVGDSNAGIGNSSVAVLWSPSGTVGVLQDVPGGVNISAAVAINASGQSVGWSCTTSSCSGQDAVLWSSSRAATVLTDAGKQGFSQAVAINFSGQSIGFSKTKNGQDAALWESNGAAQVLHDAGGQGVDDALAINKAGDSVGYSDIAGGGTEAVLWSSTGQATTFGALLGSAWSDTVAVGLNNNGDIIGYGDYTCTPQPQCGVTGIYGFLLTPKGAASVFSATPFSASSAPELSTWAMLLVGFAGLGVASLRRSRPGVRESN